MIGFILGIIGIVWFIHDCRNEKKNIVITTLYDVYGNEYYFKSVSYNMPTATRLRRGEFVQFLDGYPPLALHKPD